MAFAASRSQSSARCRYSCDDVETKPQPPSRYERERDRVSQSPVRKERLLTIGQAALKRWKSLPVNRLPFVVAALVERLRSRFQFLRVIVQTFTRFVTGQCPGQRAGV